MKIKIFKTGELLPGLNSDHLKEHFLCWPVVSYHAEWLSIRIILKTTLFLNRLF